MRSVFVILGIVGAVALTSPTLLGKNHKDHAHQEKDEWIVKTMTWEDASGVTLESTVVYEADEADEPMPGVLMVPNWMGPTEASLEKAKNVAEEGVVVMMVDMYGTETRPSNADEAGAAAGVVRGDRALMRERMRLAHENFLAAENLPLDKENIAAIGFCFGGGTVLEYARSGADLKGVVSFHGDLMSPTLEEDSGKIQSAVLVLHGAKDPLVPQDHVQTFVRTMLTTSADWQLVQFGDAVHSFTDPNATWAGNAEYHEQSAERAFEMMEDFFEEIFDEED